MKIGIAQIQPASGNIPENLALHLEYARKAVDMGAELLFFPELSLTGYEPLLAGQLALTGSEVLLEPLQQISSAGNLHLAVGIPAVAPGGTRISLLFFSPQGSRTLYSKQQLHEDELPYFIPGTEQLILKEKDEVLAPAICYESLQPDHAENAAALGATVYLASVAKSANGVEKAYRHYPALARDLGLTVLMANALGPCDNFVSAGGSAVWNRSGRLVAKLDEHPGILVYDSRSGTAECLLG